jgi:hypothetical protein
VPSGIAIGPSGNRSPDVISVNSMTHPHAVDGAVAIRGILPPVDSDR